MPFVTHSFSAEIILVSGWLLWNITQTHAVVLFALVCQCCSIHCCNWSKGNTICNSNFLLGEVRAVYRFCYRPKTWTPTCCLSMNMLFNKASVPVIILHWSKQGNKSFDVRKVDIPFHSHISFSIVM